MSIREIATALAEQGYPLVNKDAVHRHLRACVADLEPPPADAADRALLVSVLVRDKLRNWHGLADSLAVELHQHGLSAEAEVVQSACCQMMRTALDALPHGSPSAALLEAEALARSVRSVLRRPAPGHASVALAIAVELRQFGAISLAEAFEFLAATDSPAGGEVQGQASARPGLSQSQLEEQP